MFKGKKIFITTITLGTILLTSTMAQASNFRYKPSFKNYNFNWQMTSHHHRRPTYNRPVEPNKPGDKNESETPSTPNVSESNQIEQEVLRLINIERSKAGLPAFTSSSQLVQVAREKSKDMAVNNYFSHTSPTYGSAFDMLSSFNISYKTAGENIAQGYQNAESVVKGWMNSQGHRDNILNSSFNTIGIGTYTDGNGTIYWTQIFTD